MELETTQTSTTSKLPMLKQGEYEMWRLRIEQYFLVQDYALWDIIESGNSFIPVTQTTTAEGGAITTTISSPVTAEEKIKKKNNVKARRGAITTTISSPVTAEEKTKKKNDVKARSMLLMELPNEYLMTFNQFKDAKSLFAAIETRFGGSAEGLGTRIAETGIKIALEGLCMWKKYLPKLWSLLMELVLTRAIWLKMSYGPKSCEIESKDASEDIPNELKEYPNAPFVKIGCQIINCSVESLVVVEKKTVVPTIAKVEVVRPNNKKSQLENQLDIINAHRVQIRPKAVNTARPKVVNTARPSPAVVNAVRENQVNVVKASAWNMFYLLDFKELNGGYVTFGEGANGGRITASKDETTGILKKFITKIKNLVDKKVKVIRCDNETEFKNIVMNDFCAMKGIRREFSVARTPHQNGIVERRNRTLIEAARTMLADWEFSVARTPHQNGIVERRNRTLIEAARTMLADWALVVKPHNKTPYELFRGRTPALSFMRPFGCHVTILDTLDHLGKFDEKADEDFFVGYSMNSKAFRVYNIRTRIVKENLHIEFLENKPIVAGDGPEWLFDIDMLTTSMNYVPDVAGTNSNDFADGSPLFDSSPKIYDDAGSPSSGDAGKKHDEVSDKESGALNELNSAFENLNTEYPVFNPCQSYSYYQNSQESSTQA
nr:hypothetical protein [Tanacetum cinerariifolium]